MCMCVFVFREVMNKQFFPVSLQSFYFDHDYRNLEGKLWQ